MAGTLSISESAILFKRHDCTRPGMSGTQLYDIIRGVWKRRETRAERAALAMTVFDDKVLEVCMISSWRRANTTPDLSDRTDQAKPQYATRYEFSGHVRPHRSEVNTSGSRLITFSAGARLFHP